MARHPDPSDPDAKFRCMAAQNLGFSFVGIAADDLADGPQQLFHPDGFVTLENVLHRREAGALFLAGDLSYESRRTVKGLTVAYLEAKDLDLPPFTLRPEGWMLNQLSAIFCGYEDIDFKSYPKFSKDYHLSSPYPDATRALFGPRLLGLFSKTPGLTVLARGTRVGIQSKALGPRELEAFVTLAREILSTIRDEGRREMAERSGREGAARPDARAEAARMTGWMAKRIQKCLLCGDELQAALEEPRPRTPPPSSSPCCARDSRTSRRSGTERGTVG